MDSKFELSVEMSEQNYEIVLNDYNLSSISFTDIYDKLKQVVKIALNEDIDFKTHEFEVFETKYSTEGSVVCVMNQILRNKSLIRIKPKPVITLSSVANQNGRVVLNIPQIDGTPRPSLLFYNPISKTLTLQQPSPQIVVQPNPQPLRPLLPQPKPQTQVMAVLPNFIPLSNNSTTNSKTVSSPRPKSSHSNGSHKRSTISSTLSASKRNRNFYCKVCPVLLDIPLNNDLLKYKTTLKMGTYRRYHHLFKTVANICDKKYHSLTTRDWNEVIPNKMKALGYKAFTPEEWKNSFHSFIEKYREVLSVAPNPEVACNLFPFFHVFNLFVFNSKEYYFVRINELKEKLRLSSYKRTAESLLIKRPTDGSPKRPVNLGKDFEGLVRKLISSENIIKVFHSMVNEINIGWNFIESGDKYWKLLADKMFGTDAKYRYIVTSDVCKTRFYIWSRFYAQTYDKLNGKLEPKLQKIFDFLKIIHVLDLSQLFSTQSSTYIKIKDISLKKELRDYFNKYLFDIRFKKIMEKHITNKDNCDTTTTPQPATDSIQRTNNFTPIRIRIQNHLLKKKEPTNGRQITKRFLKNGKESESSAGKEANFIPLSQTPSDIIRKRVIDRAKQFLSKHSAKQPTDSIRRFRQIRPKEHRIIETIVLD